MHSSFHPFQAQHVASLRTQYTAVFCSVVVSWSLEHPSLNSIYCFIHGPGSGVSEPLLAERAQERLQHHEGTQQRSSEVQQQQQQGGGRMNLKEGLLLCIPTGFDLTATTLMNVGLLYVAASGVCLCACGIASLCFVYMCACGRAGGRARALPCAFVPAVFEHTLFFMPRLCVVWGWVKCICVLCGFCRAHTTNRKLMHAPHKDKHSTCVTLSHV